MAGEMTVQTGWVVKDVRGQEVGFHTLPTMADTGDVDLRGFFRTVYRGKWIRFLTMAAAIRCDPVLDAERRPSLQPRSSS